MEKLNLNGLWQMNRSGGGQKLPVKIPGSVLSGLLDNKKIADPYYRTNEYETRELLRDDYSFTREFDCPSPWLNKLNKACDGDCGEASAVLVCEGLDTIAEVILNGEVIGRADNMHRTWRFDCTRLLKEKNTLCIQFTSPLMWTENYPKTPGKEIDYTACGCRPGSQYIRKAHSMFGWDWGPQLPDMGIWRDIYIEYTQGARFCDIEFHQEHMENKVRLKAAAEIVLPEAQSFQEKGAERLWTGYKTFENGVRAEAVLKTPDGETAAEAVYDSMPEAVKIEFVFDIERPLLWWPNGLGAHPLYTVGLKLYGTDGELLDERSFKIGLRTLKVSTEKDEWGSEFAFVVNGVKVFTMGADYIPEDCIYSRISKEKIKNLIQTAVRSNFNCLRVWGGGYYPSDDFYNLCDENGLIVWQDLMYACNIYDLDESFEENIIAETEDNVRRLRHHACLGLWCGNNEMEMGWIDWEDVRCHSGRLKADYIKQFEYILPKAVGKADKETFYWPSSPSSGGGFERPNDENHGDTHYWDVWHGQKPFSDYRKYYFRFCSEFGFQSFPSLKTIKSFTEPEDRNIFSEVMESHQKNGAANGKILYYLSENFKYPKDFESLLYVSQILQGLAIKYGVEHWRRNRGRCMGALYWQLNDNWPVASWSSIDYFGRWKVLQYMAGKFFAPELGTVCEENGTVLAAAVNDTAKKLYVRAVLRLKTMTFDILDEYVLEQEIPAFSAVKLGNRDYSVFFAENNTEGFGKNSIFAEAEFEFSEFCESSAATCKIPLKSLNGECAEGRKVFYKSVQTEVFVPYKYAALSSPAIELETAEEEDCFVIKLKTDVFTPFVWLDLKQGDTIFSDNCFCMTGPEPVVVRADKRDCVTGKILEFETFKKQLTVRSLYDTFC